MDKYKIFETDEFLKKLRKLSRQDANFIQKKLNEYVYPQIREEPFLGRNIKKLRDYDPPIWRYRIGKFRVFYFIDSEEKVVYILSVVLRKDAYK
ncbi:MAG: type II toxin-antitoxin system RelE/ParE family toxin [Sedimentisphaerales bacterium]